MIKWFKNYINKSEFTKNVLTLVTGASVAQILPILVSPILTRIYSPTDFGVLAIFTSIVVIFGTIANGRYELAVIIPDKDSDAINVFALGVFISFVLSVFLFVFVLVFHSNIMVWLENKDIGPYLYIAPFVVLLVGIFNMLNYFSTRQKQYKTIAYANVHKSIGTVAVQLGLFFVKDGTVGLISGYSFGQLMGNRKLLKNVTRDKELLRKINKRDIKKQARRFSRFPKLTLPASLANTLSNELTNIFISKLFTVKTLGFYSFAIKILRVPTTFISKSVSQVYLQEAANEKREKGTAIKTFNGTLKKLLVVGVPLFAILYFASEYIFAFVYGEEWRIAGKYAQIITPLLFMRFVVSPVSTSLSVFEKQHISLLWQIGLLSIALGSLSLPYLFGWEFENYLKTFVLITVFYYFVFLFILNKVVRGKL